MAPRFRPRPKVKPKLNVTTTSSKAELKQALDQARENVRQTQESGTPRQKEAAQKRYINILQMQPQVIPTGQGGDSIRNLTTKERVKNGNIETYGDKPIPLGERLRREQDADAGEKPISEYIKKKYPNKKKGGKITYKMTGGQVVAISYD
jgi:hypothetical protein